MKQCASLACSFLTTRWPCFLLEDGCGGLETGAPTPRVLGRLVDLADLLSGDFGDGGLVPAPASDPLVFYCLSLMTQLLFRLEKPLEACSSSEEAGPGVCKTSPWLWVSRSVLSGSGNPDPELALATSVVLENSPELGTQGTLPEYLALSRSTA